MTLVRELEVEDALLSNNSIEELEQSIIDQVRTHMCMYIQRFWSKLQIK